MVVSYFFTLPAAAMNPYGAVAKFTDPIFVLVFSNGYDALSCCQLLEFP